MTFATQDWYDAKELKPTLHLRQRISVQRRWIDGVEIFDHHTVVEQLWRSADGAEEWRLLPIVEG